MNPDLLSSSLHLIVKDREKILFEGVVKSFTAVNKVGTFDVLPGHANFISIVDTSIHFVKENGEVGDMAVNNAVLRVFKNRLTVFLGVKKETEKQIS